MSLLKKINKWMGEKEEKEEIWVPITEEIQVDQVLIASVSKTQIILKHSNSCGTSFFAKKDLEINGFWDHKNANLNIIDVIRNRPVSLYFADKVGIRHESPQLVVISNKEVIWHGSHSAVNRSNVEKALELLG